MKVGLIGTLTAPQERALEAVGIHLVAPDRAAVRIAVNARLPARLPKAPWLWLVPRVDPARATAAVLGGAYDVIALEDETFATIVRRRLDELAMSAVRVEPPADFVGRSAAATRLFVDLDRAARTSMAVLLTGETGTGKDLAARFLHARSRRTGDFVPINCAAIPNELIEGELFGYARGAFSGAVAEYPGLIRAAAGGTVFLDEVDDTPKTLQIKLLRVLEDRVVSRLGENEWREVDFRIIAATNRDLEVLVGRDEFGADLYQRLAIVRIEVPPLRDRLDDLPELSAHMIARFYREEPAMPHRVTRISENARAALARYPWPGNIRELRNVLFHALVRKNGGDELLLSDLPEHVVRGTSATGTTILDRAALARSIESGQMNLRALRDELEREALRIALARSDGNVTAMARMLGEVGRGTARDPSGTVRAMLRRHGLHE